MLKIAYSPIYVLPLPAKHRFPMEKYELIPEQLLYEGTATEDNFFAPMMISREALEITHTPEYVDRVLNKDLTKKEIRDIGYPMSQRLVDRERIITGGTLECVEYARKYGISMNVSGGTHHAFAESGGGFCIFNDVAVTANVLLKENPDQKILILDLDVHQGDGTASLMKDESRVFTLSVHGGKNYPMRKEVSDWDIPLEDHTRDDEYLAVIENVLEELPHHIIPDIVLYICGADVLESDRLGRLSLTVEGVRKRDEMVLSHFYDQNIPLVGTLGGGYSHRLPDLIEAHANTFRIAAHFVE